MELRIGCVLVGFLSLVLSLAAQTSGSGPASALVPPLVNFSGVLTDVDGKPLTVTVGVTFVTVTVEETPDALLYFEELLESGV